MASKADDKAQPEAVHLDGAAQEVTTSASVALAAAVAAEKPDPWSRGMLKLYVIMGIGYLVSTMNGFGTLLNPSIT
jgi:hypothetical protein